MTTFRQLLAGDDLVVAPGAYDAITARLIEAAGFPLVFMTGAGVAASRGFPDVGLVTLTEAAESAGTIARSVSIPVHVDIDTGFGGELNVTRTVRDMERQGVAGVQIEDQVHPKRGGHLGGHQVVDVGDFALRVAAAVAARSSDDLVVVARTDAIGVHGLDDAIARLDAAFDAGADAGFIEGATTAADLAAIPERLDGPCVINLLPGGASEVGTPAEAAELGFRVALCPGLLLGTLVDAGARALDELARSGTQTAGAGARAHLASLGAEWADVPGPDGAST